MATLKLLVLCFVCLISIPRSGLCQSLREYVVTAQTSGDIQFRDPGTLEVISTLHVDVPPNSTGIDGVFADPNGRTLYIEGPEHEDVTRSSGCCWLYSVDLASAQAKVVAGIWGSKSRGAFASAGPSLLAAVSPVGLPSTPTEMERWHISPDGRWRAGLRRGPSVDLYDTKQNKVVKSFTAEAGNSEWYVTGAWLKDQFYIYTTHDGSGWLWHMSPDSDRFEQAAPVSGPVAVQGCRENRPLFEMTATSDHLVLFEPFGGKIDGRVQCGAVPGGAWSIEPAFHEPVASIAPHLYFWRLIPSRDGSSLYGVTSDTSDATSSSQLVHLDAHSGNLLGGQILGGRYTWIAAARLLELPRGSRWLALPADNAR